MKQMLSILLASALVHTCIAASFTWNCEKTINTCQNYCYWAQCRPGGGGQKFFTYDSAGADNRRKDSGCKKNPCNASSGVSPFNTFGSSCDEFPFASTKEGGTGASLRCVDPSENSSEGGQLGAFYTKEKLKAGDKYNIFIENWKGAIDCEAKPNCKNTNSAQFKMDSAGKFVKNSRRSLAGSFVADPGLPDTDAVRPFRVFEADDGSEHSLLSSSDDHDDYIGTRVWSSSRNTYVTMVKEL